MMRRGLALIEVAPGTDAARDILAHMDFELIIRLDEAFAQRNIASHVFERKEEAQEETQAFLAAVGVGTGNNV